MWALECTQDYLVFNILKTQRKLYRLLSLEKLIILLNQD